MFYDITCNNLICHVYSLTCRNTSRSSDDDSDAKTRVLTQLHHIIAFSWLPAHDCNTSKATIYSPIMIPSQFPVATNELPPNALESLSVHARNSKTTTFIPGLYPNGAKVVLARNTRNRGLCWVAKQSLSLGSTVSFVCPPEHVLGSPTSWLNNCAEGIYIKQCTSHDECMSKISKSLKLA